MLKMIIIDDEYIILESLEKLIDWESAGIKVVGTADNGAAAMDLTLKRNPDIILSDISMPFFSGLEMLETLRKKGVSAEVIFISAYGKFEYAQEALKFGAFDYILKPINEDKLLETVKRCRDKIKNSAQPVFDGWTEHIKSGKSVCYNKIAGLTPSESVTLDSVKMEILDAVKSSDTVAATKLFEFFAIINRDDDIFDADTVRLWCIELLDFILRSLKDYKLDDYLENPQKSLSAKKGITSGASLDDVFDITHNLITNVSLYVKEIQANSSKRIINLAIAYIQENYKKDTTLSHTADHLYVSPAYLSRIFSAEMQESFSHYLLKYRIDTAKKLLRDTRLKIYEVASEVGYSDVAHFSKSFKQITGVTPIRYREYPRS